LVGIFQSSNGAVFASVSPKDIQRSTAIELRTFPTRPDSIYSSNSTKFLGSKNISLTPYPMTEDRSSDQGFLKGIGNITYNQTFISTHLSDELIQSTGNGTFETPDGESIAWISSAIGRPVDDRWVFYGIRLFNNTQSKSLSLLNNSIGLAKSQIISGF
jgi:hypothetical protein